MKHIKLLTAILAAIVIVLLAFIVSPILNLQEYSAEQENIRKVPETINEESENTGKEPEIINSNQLIFNLKYEQHLIPYPYTYEYMEETRTFEFQKMIETAKVAASEFDKGNLTYVSNYKDEHGKAPLYKGETTDKNGRLRGAAAPAYEDLNNAEEFDYLPDGTLVRVLEECVAENSGFSKVYSIKDQREYYIPHKYIEWQRRLLKVEKVIVVDLKNQTIAALENNIHLKYFKDSNTYLKNDWEIVSYSKCTTGKLGTYHQPTPEGYFYAIEKKPFFYYLADGTNIIAGKEPWAIRFTAGAYIHGMSLGEYSPAIGTVPLSHKCVRNYTSHAKFLYDWYEEDKTIVTVIN